MSNSDIYGLLSHLEQISNIRVPSDDCWLEEFWVWTFFSGALHIATPVSVQYKVLICPQNCKENVTL